MLRELGGRRRLARALQARHQDDRRRLRREVEVGDAFAHRRGELAVDDADESLSGRERADHLGAECPLLDAGDEVAHHRQRDVGLEERHAHLAQHVLHVVFGDARLAAHRLDEPAQAVGEGGGHRARTRRDRRCESTLADDSIVRSDPAGTSADGACAELCRASLALVGYPAAAMPSERFSSLRARLAGRLDRPRPRSIVIDVAGIGSRRPGARFGFAPALSVTLWLVLAVYELESRYVPLAGARRALACARRRRRRLAWAFPGQRRIRRPASPWAPLHWLLGFASYGLFGVAVLHALLLNRAERQMRRAPRARRDRRREGVPLLRLERLTYRFVAAGFAVLSAAIILGAWFSEPLALGSQVGLLDPRLARLRGPARRAPRVRLARSEGDALALCRRGPAAAGLRRLALRARGRCCIGPPASVTMKFLLFLRRCLRAALAAAQQPDGRRRGLADPHAGDRTSRSRCSPALNAAFICRTTRRCPGRGGVFCGDAHRAAFEQAPPGE